MSCQPCSQDGREEERPWERGWCIVQCYHRTNLSPSSLLASNNEEQGSARNIIGLKLESCTYWYSDLRGQGCEPQEAQRLPTVKSGVPSP